MKRFFFAGATALVGAVCFLTVAQAAETKAGLADTLAQALKQGDMPLYRATVEQWLDRFDGKLGNLAPLDRWQQLREQPGYWHGLALSELFRATGDEAMAKIAATSEGRQFLAAFFADDDWLLMYLANGPVPEKTADGLAALCAIWTADRQAGRTTDYRLATAVALAFHSSPQRELLHNLMHRDRGAVTPAARYQFYRESEQAGRLRPLFKNLAVWELRWVVCAPVENEALTWLQDNVNVPLTDFDDVCWVPHYRGVNDFGDSIQGPLFYAASRSHCNWAEDIARHGGVCGSLSTFGAINAMAHGVPATPKGQPGHCAFAVRVAPGDWMPGFGGPDGGAAYHYWKGSFSYVWLADDAFADASRMRISMQLAWLARRAAAKGSRPDARAWYALAVRCQPLNWPVWEEYIAGCREEKSLDKAFWTGLADNLLTGMARHPHPLCDLLAQFDEQFLWPALSVSERQAHFLKIHETIAANQRPGWTPWDMPAAVVARQVKGLDDVQTAALLGKMLAPYIRHGHEYLAGQLVEWAGNRLGNKPEGAEQLCLAIHAAVLGSGRPADDNFRRGILNNAIRMAERSGSFEGFRRLSDAAAAYADRGGEFRVERPRQGRLISGDALLTLSGFDNWDNPAAHRDVLTEKGGFFHAQPDKSDKQGVPWVAVRFRKPQAIRSVVVVNRLNNQARCKSLRISTSTDGKTWQPAAESTAFGQQWTADLSDKKIVCLWLKVENTTKSDAFHLRNICVYGEDAS